jgi:hypothetical protein
MKYFFKKIIKFSLVLFALGTVIVLVSGVYYYKEIKNSQQNPGDSSEAKSIEFQNPKNETFAWVYDGKKYSITETLYQSAYDFYRSEPKRYEYNTENPPTDWQNEYYGLFLKTAINDDTFSHIAKDIKAAGEQQKLAEDKILELALAFVQAIPYDDDRAKAILASSEDSDDPNVLPKYPYETLYEHKGVCSDKSFLSTIILRQLGYGTAIFEYSAARHMAIGIECPAEYSTANTGYCYAETTTAGHRVGIIPQLDSLNLKALPKKELAYFNDQQNENSSGTTLDNPVIYQKTSGKSYQAVVATYKIQNDLVVLEKVLAGLGTQLKALKQQVISQEQGLKSLQSKMNSYMHDKEYEKYNSFVPKYNDSLKSYQQSVKNYNAKVSEYNSNVSKYNKLVKDFSVTE